MWVDMKEEEQGFDVEKEIRGELYLSLVFLGGVTVPRF